MLIIFPWGCRGRDRPNLVYVLLPTYEQVKRKQKQEHDRLGSPVNECELCTLRPEGSAPTAHVAPGLPIKDEPIEDTYLYTPASVNATRGPAEPGPSTEEAALQLSNVCFLSMHEPASF